MMAQIYHPILDVIREVPEVSVQHWEQYGWELVNDFTQSASGMRTVFYGDSLTYVSGSQGYAVDTDRGSTGYSSWTEMLYGGLRPLTNEGASGETIAQVAARVGNVTSRVPNLVFLMSSGVNSVKGAVSLVSMQTDLTKIFNAIRNAGATLITSTVTPSDLIDTVPEIQNLFDLNRWLIGQGSVRPDLIVVDGYTLMADPTLATIGYRPGYSTDGTHPNAVGSAVLGQAFADVLRTLKPSVPTALPMSNLDPVELLPNSMGNGSGGTLGFPDSWTQTGGTGSVTQIAREDELPGNWQEWVQTAGTNFVLQETSTGFDVGDQVQARFELDLVDTSGLTGGNHFAYVECRNGGTPLDAVSVGLGNDSEGFPQVGPLTLTTNPIEIPATTTTIRVAHRMTGAATVRFGRMSIRVVV